MDLLVVPDTSHFFRLFNSNHVSAEGVFLPEQVTADIHTGKQGRALKWIPLSLFIGEMQATPKEYHDPGSQLCKIMQDRYGRCETDEGGAWAGDARSCSLVLADAPARFTSPRCFSSVDCWDEDAPGLSRCSGASGCPGPLLTPCFASCSSLLMQKRRRSVTRSHDAQGARTRR